ncbi:hypothetical protein [Mycoplasma sp. 613B]
MKIKNKKKKSLLILLLILVPGFIATAATLPFAFFKKQKEQIEKNPIIGDQKASINKVNKIEFANITENSVSVSLQPENKFEISPSSKITLELSNGTKAVAEKWKFNDKNIVLEINKLKENTNYTIYGIEVDNKPLQINSLAKKTFKTNKQFFAQNTEIINIKETEATLNFDFEENINHFNSLSIEFLNGKAQNFSNVHINNHKVDLKLESLIASTDYTITKIMYNQHNILKKNIKFTTLEKQKVILRDFKVLKNKENSVKLEISIDNSNLISNDQEIFINLRSKNGNEEKRINNFSVFENKITFVIDDLQSDTSYTIDTIKNNQDFWNLNNSDFNFKTLEKHYFVSNIKVKDIETNSARLVLDLNENIELQKVEIKLDKKIEPFVFTFSNTNKNIELLLNDLMDNQNYFIEYIKINDKNIQFPIFNFKTQLSAPIINNISLVEKDTNTATLDFIFSNKEYFSTSKIITITLEFKEGEEIKEKEFNFTINNNENSLSEHFNFYNLLPSTIYKVKKVEVEGNVLKSKVSNFSFRTSDIVIEHEKNITLSEISSTTNSAVIQLSNLSDNLDNNDIENIKIKLVNEEDYKNVEFTKEDNVIQIHLSNLNENSTYQIENLKINDVVYNPTNVFSFKTKEEEVKNTNIQILSLNTHFAQLQLSFNKGNAFIDGDLLVIETRDEQGQFQQFSQEWRASNSSIILNNLKSNTSYYINKIYKNNKEIFIESTNRNFHTSALRMENFEVINTTENSAKIKVSLNNISLFDKGNRIKLILSNSGQQEEKEAKNYEVNGNDIYFTIDNLNKNTTYNVVNFKYNEETVVLDHSFPTIQTKNSLQIENISYKDISQKSATVILTFTNVIDKNVNKHLNITLDNNERYFQTSFILNDSNQLEISFDNLQPNRNYSINSIMIDNEEINISNLNTQFKTLKNPKIRDFTVNSITSDSVDLTLNFENLIYNSNSIFNIKFSNLESISILSSKILNNSLNLHLNNLHSNSLYVLEEITLNNNNVEKERDFSFETLPNLNLTNKRITNITHNSALLVLTFENINDVDSRQPIIVELNNGDSYRFNDYQKENDSISLSLESLSANTTYKILSIRHKNQNLISNEQIDFRTLLIPSSLSYVTQNSSTYNSIDFTLNFRNPEWIEINKPITIVLEKNTTKEEISKTFNPFNLINKASKFTFNDLESNTIYKLKSIMHKNTQLLTTTNSFVFQTTKNINLENGIIHSVTTNSAVLNLTFNSLKDIDNTVPIVVEFSNGTTLEFINYEKQGNLISLHLNHLVPYTNYSVFSIKYNRKNILNNLNVNSFRTEQTASSVVNVTEDNKSYNSLNLAFEFSNKEWMNLSSPLTFELKNLSNNKVVRQEFAHFNIENNLAKFVFQNLESNSNYQIIKVEHKQQNILNSNSQYVFATTKHIHLLSKSVDHITAEAATLNLTFENNKDLNNSEPITIVLSNGTSKNFAHYVLNNNQVSFQLDNLFAFTDYQITSINYGNIRLLNNYETINFKTKQRISSLLGINNLLSSYNSLKLNFTFSNKEWIDVHHPFVIELLNTSNNQTISKTFNAFSVENNQIHFVFDNLISNTTYKVKNVKHQEINLLPENSPYYFTTNKDVKITSTSIDNITLNSASLHLNFRAIKDINTYNPFIIEFQGGETKTISHYSINNNIVTINLSNLVESQNYSITQIKYENKNLIENSINFRTDDFVSINNYSVANVNEHSASINVVFNNPKYLNSNENITLEFSNGLVKTFSHNLITNNSLSQIISGLNPNTTYTLKNIKLGNIILNHSGVYISFTTAKSVTVVSGLNFSNITYNSANLNINLSNTDWLEQNQNLVIYLIKNNTNTEIRKEATLSSNNSNITLNLNNLDSNSTYRISRINYKNIDLQINTNTREFSTKKDILLKTIQSSDVQIASAKLTLKLRSTKDISTSDRLTVVLNNREKNIDNFRIIDSTTIDLMLNNLDFNTHYTVNNVKYNNQSMEKDSSFRTISFTTKDNPQRIKVSNISTEHITTSSANMIISFENASQFDKTKELVLNFNNNYSKRFTNIVLLNNNISLSLDNLLDNTEYVLQSITYDGRSLEIKPEVVKNFRTEARKLEVASIQVKNLESDYGVSADFVLRFKNQDLFTAKKELKIKIQDVNEARRTVYAKSKDIALDYDNKIILSTNSLYNNRIFRITDVLFDNVSIKFPNVDDFKPFKRAKPLISDGTPPEPDYPEPTIEEPSNNQPSTPNPEPTPAPKPKPNYNYDQPHNQDEHTRYYSGTSLNNLDWMKSLDDSARISDLSIPGTHDSAMFSGTGFYYFFGKDYAKTQANNYDTQLKQGIRFFDLRIDENMNLRHGVTYATTNLSNAVRDFAYFLQRHPSEFLLLRIKSEDYKPGQSAQFRQQYRQKFENALLKHYDYLYQRESYKGTLWPTVADLRGKMMIFNDLDPEITTDTSWGPKYNSGGQAAKPYIFYTQDNFEATPNDKYDAIKGQYDISTKYKGKGVLFLNFTSHTNLPTTIFRLAEQANLKVLNLLKTYEKDHRFISGITIMDFPGDALVQQVIKMNRVK